MPTAALLPPIFSLVPIAPVVSSGDPDWTVIVRRPPAMTVVETIYGPATAETPCTFDEFHEEIANDLGRHGFTTWEEDGFDIQLGDTVEYYDRGLLIGGGVLRGSKTTKFSKRTELKVPIVWEGVRPLGVLEEGPIFPSRGLGSTAQDRIWGWFGISYDDSTWIPATEIFRHGDVSAYWTGLLPEFKDPDAWWVWASQRAGNPALDEWSPEGLCLFRQTGTVPATVTQLEIELGGDAQADIYFEGEFLMSTVYATADPDDVQRRRVDVVSGAEVLVAVACTNDPDPEGDQVQNPGGAIWSVWWIDPATGQRGDVLMHSDSTAVMLEYVPARPGVTPGEVLLEVLAELQALGYITWLIPTFTADLDSNGRPWAEVGEIGTKVGYSLWKLVQQLIAVYIDTDINPATYEWHAWSKGSRGTHRSIILTPQVGGDPETGNIAEHVVTDIFTRATDVLNFSQFGWNNRSRWTPGARRIAATLGLGALPSQTAVERYADADLDRYATNQREHDVRLQPRNDSEKPYWAFGIADTLTVDGDTEPVGQIGWKRDDLGLIQWDWDGEDELP